MEAVVPVGVVRRRASVQVAFAISLWLIAVVADLALRSTGIPLWRSVWAEDGTVFLQDAVDKSLPGALATPYAGYLHVPARLLTEIAVRFPPERWALVLAVLSVAAAAATGLYVYSASQDVLSTRWARVLVASLPWLVLVGEEVPGSVANLHWYGLYAAFWALTARPRTTRGLIAAATVVTLAALSDPMVGLGLPLALLQARALGRRGLAILLPLLAALALQAAVTLGGHGPEAATAFHAGDAAGIYGLRVAGPALLGDTWFGSLWDAAGWAAIVAAWAAAIALVAAGARHHPRLVLSAAAGSLLLLFVPLFLRGTAGIAPGDGMGATRYMLVPAALLLVCAIAALDRVGSHRARQLLVVLLLAVAISGFGAPSERGEGPEWAPALHAACASGAPTAPVTIAPSRHEEWRVVVSCAGV
jgi:hypothetical protein